MISPRDFQLAINDPAFQKKLKDAIVTLEELGLFASLRELADKKLVFGHDHKVDVNGLVIVSARHSGYAEALDNILNIVEYTVAVTETLNKTRRYGIGEEDVK
jgi:hypothetical protein